MYVLQCLICICACLFTSLSRYVTPVVRWGMFLSVMCSSCVYQQRTPLSWTVLLAPPHPLRIKTGPQAEVSSVSFTVPLNICLRSKHAHMETCMCMQGDDVNNAVWLESCVRCSQSSVLLRGPERRGAFLPGGGTNSADTLSPWRGLYDMYRFRGWIPQRHVAFCCQK